MVEEKFTLEWDTEETCQISKDGDYMSCDEAVELLNKYYIENKNYNELIIPIIDLLIKNNLEVGDLYSIVKIGIIEYNGVLK